MIVNNLLKQFNSIQLELNSEINSWYFTSLFWKSKTNQMYYGKFSWTQII